MNIFSKTLIILLTLILSNNSYAQEIVLSEDAMSNRKAFFIQNNDSVSLQITTDGKRNYHGSSAMKLDIKIKCNKAASFKSITNNATYLKRLKTIKLKNTAAICSVEYADMDLDNIHIAIYKRTQGRCENKAVNLFLPIRTNGLIPNTPGLCK